jgi:integrase
LALTAQRREEIGGLRWDEVTLDGDAPMIALPPSRTKNHLSHDVPLVPAAVDILRPRKRRDLHVFGRGDSGHGFRGWAFGKTAIDETCGVKGWTLHDLRRTAATRMADLGVLPHVIEAALNHISGHKSGVAGIYNRSTYAAEKREALELWAAHLAAITKA